VEAYRIYNRRYDPLDGTGAALAGGRWNPVGMQLIYAAATFEGALLEQLVHASIGKLPRNRRACRILIPDEFEIPVSDRSGTPDWMDERQSRRAGREWVESGDSVALRVPSVVSRPWGWNVLINPDHRDFGSVEIEEEIDFHWDPRLSRSS
jgi:RES domain-containing protein